MHDDGMDPALFVLYSFSAKGFWHDIKIVKYPAYSECSTSESNSDIFYDHICGILSNLSCNFGTKHRVPSTNLFSIFPRRPMTFRNAIKSFTNQTPSPDLSISRPNVLSAAPAQHDSFLGTVMRPCPATPPLLVLYPPRHCSMMTCRSPSKHAYF